jgi:chitinase
MSRTILRTASLAAILSLSSACGKSASSPPVAIAVAPQVAAVDPGKTQAFVATVTGVANQSVSWSVQEAGGGTITAAGLYTAPAVHGTYHVVATSHVDRT